MPKICERFCQKERLSWRLSQGTQFGRSFSSWPFHCQAVFVQDGMSQSHRYTSAKRVPPPRDRDSFHTNTNSPKFLCLQSPRKYGTGPGSNLQPLSLTANTGIACSIPVRSHSFLEIDHEIISTGHFPPFRWIIQEGLLSVTSKSMCTKYWLTACSSLPRKKVWLGELTVPPWP